MRCFRNIHSHSGCFCAQGAQWPPIVSRSRIRTLPYVFSWATTPFPAIPCHPHLIIPPSPNRHDIPLLKILFIGHRVSVQVIMMVMGSVVVTRLRHTQGGSVSIPSQRLHGQAQNMIGHFEHRPQLSAVRKIDHLPPNSSPRDQLGDAYGHFLPLRLFMQPCLPYPPVLQQLLSF